MPVYEFICPSGHITERRSDLDTDTIECPEPVDRLGPLCRLPARRRPFYESQAVTNLPTRGPILPIRPKPRSTHGEKPDYAKEIWDETAWQQYQYDKRYGPGGDYADSTDKPINARRKRRD